MQTPKPIHNPSNMLPVNSLSHGSKKSFEIVPSNDVLIPIPIAKEISLPLNHSEIIAAWATFELSPHPLNPLPNNAIGKDSIVTPKEKIACPIDTQEQNRIIPARIPILSIKKPPKKGRITFGNE